MSFQDFQNKVASSGDLQNKLNAANSTAEIVSIAKGEGYDITEADVEQYAKSQDGELSEGELESAAGGGGISVRIRW